MALSGAAAVNIGGGARTIDSVSHTNTDNADEDLVGEELDRRVALLEDVELAIVIIISTVGAAQFEIMKRRLEQVGKVWWRRRFGTRPPDNQGGFGSLGDVLIGDFAQLPPIRSSTLMPGARLEEGRRSSLRALALAGRQRPSRASRTLFAGGSLTACRRRSLTKSPH